jgi:hypothetical protein
MNDTPEHVYLDINVYNQPDENDFNSPAVNLEYVESRQSSILPTPSEEWNMSIVRFSLQSASVLPIWYPKLQLNQSDPTKLVYKITVRWKAPPPYLPVIYEVSKNVKWYAEIVTAKVPVPDTGGNFTYQPFSEYYCTYSSQHIIRVFNATLRDLYEELYTLCVPFGFPFREDYIYSFFELDANNRWSLNSDYELYDYFYLRTDRVNPPAGYAAMYINPALYNIICSFPCSKVHQGLDGYKMWRFAITNNSNANILTTTTTPERRYIQTFQEYDSSSLMCPVQAIVFKTSTMPITNTLTSPSTILNSSNNGLLNTGNNSMTDNIMTDMMVHMEDISSYQGIISYTPTAEYRLLPLIGNSRFNEINISAFWKDETGFLRPIYLVAGANFNCKIMFRKKSYNGSNYRLLK